MLCNFCKDCCSDVLRWDLELDSSSTWNSRDHFLSAQTVWQLDEGIRLGCRICLEFWGNLSEAD